MSADLAKKGGFGSKLKELFQSIISFGDD